MAMKRRRTRARRRSNPVPVIFANPRKRRRTRRRRRSNPSVGSTAKHYHSGAQSYARRGAKHPRSWIKSRPRKRRRTHGRKRRFARVAGVRRYDRKRKSVVRLRKPYRRGRGGRMVRVRRLYRRTNPMSLSGIKSLIRPAFFGGLGVITARVGKHLYQKYLSNTVAGDGSSSIRGYLNEALGLASMAVMTIGVEKGLKRVPGVRGEDCTAFRYGGLAETGRQLIGVVVKKVRPSTNMETWGLNGYGMPGQGRMIGESSFMGELESADSYMGELESLDSFQGSDAGPFVIRN